MCQRDGSLLARPLRMRSPWRRARCIGRAPARVRMPRRNLLIVADPLWMCGPFAWDGSKLRVEVVAATSAVVDAEGQLFRLHDPIGFELLTGFLEAKENVALD